MRHWLGDTLARRLMVLLWAALVVSHLLAFLAVRLVHLQPPQGSDGTAVPLPILPSLPPTPGLPQPGPMPDAPPGHGPPELGWNLLLLDYGVRLTVIALAAWWGSRWLARPMKELAQAGAALGRSIARPEAPPPLDDQRGCREVRDAARVFNTMAGQLHQQFHARSLMLAAISHDLRTPLTRLRLRLASMPAEPAMAERCSADIQEIDTLIGRTLQAFRAGHGDADERAHSTDVRALVQALCDDAAEQGQAVEGPPDGPAVVVRVQVSALRRAVQNLLDNALRYGQRARVTVVARPGSATIVVDDDGPGIPTAQLKAVLQPYVRLETSRNRGTGGTGLGLYIAHDLLQRQGGSLRLSNRPGGGLRAEVVLGAGGGTSPS